MEKLLIISTVMAAVAVAAIFGGSASARDASATSGQPSLGSAEECFTYNIITGAAASTCNATSSCR